LVPAVTTRLQIASIHLDATEDAQEIFETLNARGTPLTAADLVKNFVFQRLGTSPEETERAYDRYWREFETPFWEKEVQTGRITYVRSSLFLGQWLTARTLEDFPAREVFSRFKHHVATSASDVGKLLPGLRAAAGRYRSIIEGSQRKAGELARLELFAYRISVLDSEIARPIVIWLGEPEQEGVPAQVCDELLGILESWFVRRALARVESRGSNRFMVDLLQHLAGQPKDKIAEAARIFLATNQTGVGYWPGDDEVASILTEVEAYRRYPRGRLRMVLEAVEDRKRGYPDGGRLTLGPVERGVATIEHVMPQQWEVHWPADLTPEQKDERDRLVQTIGNLTLVTKALNAKVSNGPWQQKRKHFEQHDDLLLTREVVVSGVDGWDEGRIVARTRSLIDHILAIWPVPPGHVGRRAAVPRQSTSVPAVDVATLVAAGRLPAGVVLRARQGRHGHRTAVVSQDGRIFVDDQPYNSPSTAASAIVPDHAVNGWLFWTIDGTPTTLADIRSDYLESLGSNT